MKTWKELLKKYGTEKKAARAYVAQLPQTIGACIDALDPSAKLPSPVLRQMLIQRVLSLGRGYEGSLYALDRVNGLPELTSEMKSHHLKNVISKANTYNRVRHMRETIVPKYLNSPEVWAKGLRQLVTRQERKFLTAFDNTLESLGSVNLSNPETFSLLDYAAEKQMKSLEDAERLLHFLPANYNGEVIFRRMLDEFAKTREEFLAIWRNPFVPQGYRNLAISKAAQLCNTTKEREEVLLDRGCLRDASRNHEDELFTSRALHVHLLDCAEKLLADADCLKDCWRYFGPRSDLWNNQKVLGEKRHRPFAGQKALVEAAVKRSLALEWDLERLLSSQTVETMGILCVDTLSKYRPVLEEYWIALWTRVIKSTDSSEKLTSCADYLDDLRILEANDHALSKVIIKHGDRWS